MFAGWNIFIALFFIFSCCGSCPPVALSLESYSDSIWGPLVLIKAAHDRWSQAEWTLSAWWRTQPFTDWNPHSWELAKQSLARASPERSLKAGQEPTQDSKNVQGKGMEPLRKQTGSKNALAGTRLHWECSSCHEIVGSVPPDSEGRAQEHMCLV